MAAERVNHPRLSWAKRYQTTEKGQPLDFKTWHYLIGPYADNHPHIVSMKCTQVGWSLWAIADVWMNCAAGKSVFYVLPTYTVRNTFVKNRIDTGLHGSAKYRELIKDAIGSSDEVGMKHIGPGVVKFVGSNSFVEFGEFPADVLIIDEYDRCKQENMPYAYDRLDASKFQWTRILGNPTNKGRGIAKLYDASDQRTWQLKCSSCGKWQCLDWFANVIERIGDNQYELRDTKWHEGIDRDLRAFCVGCGQPMDRLARGEWIPKYPDRPVHGYTFDQICSPRKTVGAGWLAFLAAQGNATLLQWWWNSWRGQPHSPSGVQLSSALLDRCIDPEYNMPTQADGGCSMGVDVGTMINVRISVVEGEKRRAVYIGRVHEFEDLDDLMTTYGVRCCVIDGLPEARKAREFASRFPGDVYLCQYIKTEKVITKGDPGDFAMELDPVKMGVHVDRTQSLDSSHAALLNRNNILPKNAQALFTETTDSYYQQMCAPARLWDEKRERYIWDEGNDADHDRHADNYDHIAARIMGVARRILL